MSHGLTQTIDSLFAQNTNRLLPRIRLGVNSASVSNGMTVPPTPIPTPNLSNTNMMKDVEKPLAKLHRAVIMELNKNKGRRPKLSPRGPNNRVPINIPQKTLDCNQLDCSSLTSYSTTMAGRIKPRAMTAMALTPLHMPLAYKRRRWNFPGCNRSMASSMVKDLEGVAFNNPPGAASSAEGSQDMLNYIIVYLARDRRGWDLWFMNGVEWSDTSTILVVAKHFRFRVLSDIQ